MTARDITFLVFNSTITNVVQCRMYECYTDICWDTLHLESTDSKITANAGQHWHSNVTRS